MDQKWGEKRGVEAGRGDVKQKNKKASKRGCPGGGVVSKGEAIEKTMLDRFLGSQKKFTKGRQL